MSAEITPEQRSVRAQFSRLNGAKGKGPVTPEGKAKSSQNAMRHGLRASKLVVLKDEDPEEFDDFYASFHDRYKPQDPMQVSLVDRMVNCAWRLRRVGLIESKVLEHETSRNRQISEAFIEFGATTRIAGLNRYEASVERSLYRAIRTLLALQTLSQKNAPAEATDPEK